jgi:uncharacterized delta-60 repeat protein
MLNLSFRTLPGFFVLIFIFCSLISIVNAVTRDGALDPAFNANVIALDGFIRDIEVMPDGKMLVAGTFSVASGTGIKNLARLNADGSADLSFNIGTGPNNNVNDIFLRPDGSIYISGDFTQYNGVARNKIARINPNGTLDTGFNPNFGTTTVSIVAAQSDGKVIVNGPFSTVDGLPRNGLARLNADGTLDTSFVVGSGITAGGVNKGAIQPDGKILLAGNIGNYDGAAVRGIVRINTDGSRDTGFNSDISNSSGINLFGLYLTASGKIYVCGDFESKNAVRRLNSDGSTDSSFNTTNATDGIVRAVTEQSDGKVIAGGDFQNFRINNVDTTPTYGVIRFNANGSMDTSFTAQAGTSLISRDIRVIKQQPDNKVLLGGAFSYLNGAHVSGLGRFNVDSSTDNTFVGFIGKIVTPTVALAAPDGKIYVGGNFDAFGNSFRRYLVRLNSDGSLDTSFNIPADITHPVTCLALQPDGKLVVGGTTGNGEFGDIMGNGVWRLNTDGSLDAKFVAQVTTTLIAVRTVAVQPDGKILIGGSFTSVNNTARTKIARLNANGTLDTAFNPIFSAFVIRKIALDAAGNILVGGDFGTVNGSPSLNIVRLKPDGTTDSSFNVGNGANNPVYAIVVDENGGVFIGGDLSSYRSTSTGSIVKLKPDGSIDSSFRRVRINSHTYSIVLLPNKKLLISGNSDSQLNVSPRRKIFRLLPNGVIDYSFDAGVFAQNGAVGTGTVVDGLTLLPSGNIIAVGNFDTINNVSHGGVARLVNNQHIPRPGFDYEGDGKSDLTVFRPSTGVWYRLNSFQSAVRIFQFGLDGDKAIPADFDGDFLTDIAVYRPSTGVWYIWNSSDDSFTILNFGTPEDIPVATDFDGDGKADIAVFRPSTGVWYILGSESGLQIAQFGLSGDIPVPADYDGDGKSDIAVFRPSNGAWYQINSSNGAIAITAFGLNGDIPVQSDFDGDFKADIAVFRPSTGLWYLLTSSQGVQIAQFGLKGDIPVAADYDGDGKSDIAVYRAGSWYILFSSGGFTVLNFGLAGDVPQSYRPS